MLILYFVHYNFVGIHLSLKCSPAMAAGACARLRDLEWIVGLMDDRSSCSNGARYGGAWEYRG